MKTVTVYITDGDGKRIAVEVSREVAGAMAESRRAEWRNDAKERYYRDKEFGSLSRLGDSDKEITGTKTGIEDVNERAIERRTGMRAVFKQLTDRQREVVSLLYKGKSVTEAAEILGVAKPTVCKIKKAISKKFQTFLK